MRKLNIILLVLSLLLFSCKEKTPISSRDMSKIMYEMSIVDMIVENNPDILTQSDSMHVYSSIFEKYGYSDDDMVAALKYYISNPEVYVEIVKDVREALSNREEELENPEPKEPEEPKEVEEVEEQPEQEVGKIKSMDKDDIRKLEEKFK